MRTFCFIFAVMLAVAALTACAPRRSSYWGDLARGVGDVIERR